MVIPTWASMIGKDAGLFCQLQIGVGQFLKVGCNGLAACHHNDIPARLEFFLVQTVDLPETAAYPIADMGLAQLFAHSDAHTIAARSIFTGIEHQIAVGLSLSAIKPPEYVIEFQRTGKFHTNSPVGHLSKMIATSILEDRIFSRSARDFGTDQGLNNAELEQRIR